MGFFFFNPSQMQLNLKNPIAFFDLETTGLDIIHDRVVQMSILRIDLKGNEEMKSWILNPECNIPDQNAKIHGITNEMVKDKPTFKEIGKTVAQFLKGCDMAGFNSNRFDVPVLAEEFARAEVDFDLKNRKFVDVQTIYHKLEQRNLSAAYRFYCDKSLDNAHNAEADTVATYEVLKAQVEKYDIVKNDINWLAKFSTYHKNADFVGRVIFNDKKEEIFNFGKYKGKTVRAVFKRDPNYYSWIMNGDFSLYTKKVLTEIYMKEKLAIG